MPIHEFCDAYESAYAELVHLTAIDQDGFVHMSLVVAKTKVAPTKLLGMPRLDLCGAVIIAKLLSHAVEILDVPTGQVCPWSDSVILLSWLRGNPNASKHL